MIRTVVALAIPSLQALSSDQGGLMAHIKSTWGLELNDAQFELTPVLSTPQLLKCANFLTSDECERVVRASCRDNARECTEYLNHVVNTQAQGDELHSGYSDEQASVALEWSQGASAGRRTRLPRDILEELIAPKALSLLGLSHRRLHVAEQLYFRPNRAVVILRDATVVRYRKGEGVAPHVDGKDVTLLTYLTSLSQGAGGRTVFPDQGLAFQPLSGDCLIYNSRDDLLHFAEPVRTDSEEKWVMQMLLDFKIAPSEEGGPIVDWETGQLFEP